MKEKIDAYLEKVKKVHGIYVLKMSEFAKHHMYEFLDQWKEFEEEGLVDAPLLAIPDDMVLIHENHFSFERAIQIVRAGGRVRRMIWNPAFYLYFDPSTQEVMFKRHEPIGYTIKMDDLEALDWILAK